MINTKQFIALLFISLILPACGSNAPRRLSVADESAIKKVAVISMIGSSLRQQYTGLTAFGNERSVHDISEWRLDDAYEDQIRISISKHFEVVPGRVDRKQFAGVYDLNGSMDGSGFSGPNPNKLSSEFREAGARLGVDGFIVVLNSQMTDFISRSAQSLRGIGIKANGIGSTTGGSILHIVAEIYVIDAKSGLTVARRLLTSRHDGSIGENEWSLPWSYIPPDISRTNFAQLDSRQKEIIRQKLLELPQRSWEPTIFAIKH